MLRWQLQDLVDFTNQFKLDDTTNGVLNCLMIAILRTQAKGFICFLCFLRREVVGGFCQE